MSKRSRTDAGVSHTKGKSSYAKKGTRSGLSRPAQEDDHRTYDVFGYMLMGYTGIANGLTAQVANNTNGTWSKVLNQVPRDASSATCREGREIYMNQVYLKAHINGLLNNNFVKVMLVYEREQPALVGTGGGTAAVANPDDVLQNSGSLYQPIGQNRRDNARRFKIVRSWIFLVDAAAESSQGGHLIDEFIPLKGKKTQWNLANTDGGLLDMTEGALYLMVTGSAPAGTVAAPTAAGECQFTTRLYFSK